MIKRLARSLLVALVAVLLLASPVLAIVNPDSIAFYCTGLAPVYKVFYNVLEGDDMMFVAEQFIYYATTPNETASSAFLFDVVNTTTNATIASVPINAYGAKPISIYMDADQVVADGLVVGGNYTLRLTGNPLLFASTTNNTVTAVLSAADYVDQELGVDNGVAADNNLRNFLIGMAEDIDTYDAPATSYLVTVSGVQYLRTGYGDSIFLEGIPALNQMCPIIFQSVTVPMEGDEPESTGAYTSTLSPLAKWGETSANGLTNLGIYLGINQQLAGSAVLMVLAVGLAIYVYSRTQSGISVLLLVGVTPFLGAWLGLLPLALAFVYTIFLVVLMGFFFFSRGAL